MSCSTETMRRNRAFIENQIEKPKGKTNVNWKSSLYFLFLFTFITESDECEYFEWIQWSISLKWPCVTAFDNNKSNKLFTSFLCAMKIKINLANVFYSPYFVNALEHWCVGAILSSDGKIMWPLIIANKHGKWLLV